MINSVSLVMFGGDRIKMANDYTFTVDDREFKDALRRLSNASTKSLSELVNQKAYYINRRAVWYAPEVSKETISTELNQAIPLTLIKSGKRFSRSKSLKSVFGAVGNLAKVEAYRNVPLLALIIQARARNGKSSPWAGKTRAAGAAAMLTAMQRVYGARQKSRAYFKAAFATCRDVFRNATKKPLPSSDSGSLGSGTTKSISRDRGRIGDAKPATRGQKPIATFWIVSPRHDLKEAINTYATPALQRAFDEEAGDTWRKAIELEYKEQCAFLGIKTS
jgi:hypothetical protein